MRWRTLLVLIVAAVAASAVPASAGTTKANAAMDAVAWDSTNVDTDEAFVLCQVYVVDYGDDPYVNLFCVGTEGYGTAWVRVKVKGVQGKVTRVRVAHTGDCSDLSITWKKKRTNVLVTASITAENDCYLRTVRVRTSA